MCAGSGVWTEESGWSSEVRAELKAGNVERVAEEIRWRVCRALARLWRVVRRESRYRDLDMLLDYREYDGEWTTWFEENWLKPRLKALGYTHVRFFGGKTCEYDGSFRERVCELGKPGSARAEFFAYG